MRGKILQNNDFVESVARIFGFVNISMCNIEALK